MWSVTAGEGNRRSVAERDRLIERYGGNPLALKIVAPTIADLFGGAIQAFLDQGELIFGSVRYLLQEQFARLSAVESSLLLWLAILREPVTVPELSAVLNNSLPRGQILEALDTLRGRSLIEPEKQRGVLHSSRSFSNMPRRASSKPQRAKLSADDWTT